MVFIPFRSPLLRKSLLLFIPLGTKMVQFPRLSSFKYLKDQGVTPFGNLLVIASSQLSEAFRRLARPSSSVSTKASALCP